MRAVWIIAVLLTASSARAEELSLDRVVELARTRAPEPAIAGARAEEARGALIGARRIATRNPSVQVIAGPRVGDGTSTDLQATLQLPVDLGRRGRRIAVADAEIDRARVEVDAIARDTVVEAVIAYYQALAANRRLALAEDRVRIAETFETTARQRQRAGDIAEFEVNLARGEVARAKAAVLAARGEQQRGRGVLAVILGLDAASLTVTGDLANRAPLAGTDGTRPELRVLEREAKLATAEAELARTERIPALDLVLSFQHERDADIVFGGLSIALPVFERGQGDAAKAIARNRRAVAELGVRTAQVATRVTAARASFDATVAAAQVLETEAIPLATTNEKAAAASYQAGKIELATLLVIRRELLDTRREHLDRLLDAALAAVELWIARGTPPLR